MSTKLKLIILIIAISSIAAAQEIAIIPKPSKLKMKQGDFTLGEGNTLKYNSSDESLSRIAGFFNEYLNMYYGFKLSENGNGKPISLKISDNKALGDEGYQLNVSQKEISISANNPSGIFYGVQTLKQLLPVTPGIKVLPVPAVNIEDIPRYTWRGNMLDVARHFFPVSFIKKYIDILAMYKINTLHLHLTDDQGWRIEIRKYPELIETSHWRDQTLTHYFPTSKDYDGRGYGGFYTQGQIKDIVKYAEERYITIIPEIDMPAHSLSALAAYPILGCSGGPYKVVTTWGSQHDVFCVGKEETFDFIENVLDEVMELFPAKYIHIGGDECRKERWKECTHCQKRIKDNGLKDEYELQSYFIKRIEKYLASKGRRLIGWDEILQGGLAPEATVMSWRGVKGGIEAAKQKHDVIMSPNSDLYFSFWQVGLEKGTKRFLPLEKVYSYEPVPEELTEEEAEHILGIHSCLWTEYVPSTQRAEYMLLPRLQASSEVAWTPAGQKDFADFEKRILVDYKRMEMMGIIYCDHRGKVHVPFWDWDFSTTQNDGN